MKACFIPFAVEWKDQINLES